MIKRLAGVVPSFVLATRHVGSSFLDRDQPHALCIGSSESAREVLV